MPTMRSPLAAVSLCRTLSIAKTLLLSICFLTVLIGAFVAPAHAQDQDIYTDSLQSGWEDWGWADRNFSNGSPVQSGTASIRVSATQSQALFLHHAAFGTQPYKALSFWLRGTVAGQPLHIHSINNINNVVGTVVITTPPAGEWRQYIIPLSDLGVSNSTMDGLWFRNEWNGGTMTFYLDNLRLTTETVPSVVNVAVDNTRVVRAVDNRLFGINAAIYDGQFNTPTTLNLLTASDNRALRFPGGSLSDEYHWATNTTIDAGGNTYGWDWGTNFDSFANIARATNADVYITANYGNGTPQEAADWVRYSNITKGYKFKYWEIGNECFGQWETDANSVAPNRRHDPVTYANRFAQYYTAMKAVDPTIKIGAVGTALEYDYAHYTDQTVTNPRTGIGYNGWTAVMLNRLRVLGITPDYFIHHKYAQFANNEDDATLLQSAASWGSEMASIRQILKDHLGTAAATGVEIVVTENNSVAGGHTTKQTTSLVNGLFLADSLGQAAQTELNALIWWNLRNGTDPGGNNSPSLYGWRQYGDYGIVSTTNGNFPTYEVTTLMKGWARGGDLILPAVSDFGLLSVYAARRQASGTLTLLVINKSPINALNTRIALSGFSAAPTAATVTYGIAQDEAARVGNLAASVPQNGTLSGIAPNAVTASFAPYSVTLITLSPGTRPATPSQLRMTTVSGGRANLMWTDGSTNESGYEVERSADGRTWARIAILPANATTHSDTGLPLGQVRHYRVRAVNAAGASNYSNTVMGKIR